MSLMAILLTIGIVLGFAVLLYGTFFLKSDNEEGGGTKALDEIKQSVEDADAALSSINSVSSMIIDEIDIKYKELLFLYQMMEEKKKELLSHSRSTDESRDGEAAEDMEERDYSEFDKEYIHPFREDMQDREAFELKTDLEVMEIGRKMDEIRKFPKLSNQKEVLDLYEQGYDITDIAKQLNVGKGEVKLIIGLSKVGVHNE